MQPWCTWSEGWRYVRVRANVDCEVWGACRGGPYIVGVNHRILRAGQCAYLYRIPKYSNAPRHFHIRTRHAALSADANARRWTTVALQRQN